MRISYWSSDVCSSDLATGDREVLNERVTYIEGRQVDPDEESYYDLPSRSGLRETLYQHCVRGLQRALDRFGGRGLPLIGTGDWNDRSEEHTSELQSLMRISYAVFCLKKKTTEN